MCVCSLGCPARKAQTPVCLMWLVLLYSVLPYCLINDIIFENKVIEHKMCVLIFYTNLPETFLILRRTTPDTIKIQNSHHSCPILRYIEFSRQFLEYSNTKFHENPSSGSRVVPCGQTEWRTDRHDKANCRFSQFCERAQWTDGCYVQCTVQDSSIIIFVQLNGVTAPSSITSWQIRTHPA